MLNLFDCVFKRRKKSIAQSERKYIIRESAEEILRDLAQNCNEFPIPDITKIIIEYSREYPEKCIQTIQFRREPWYPAPFELWNGDLVLFDKLEYVIMRRQANGQYIEHNRLAANYIIQLKSNSLMFCNDTKFFVCDCDGNGSEKFDIQTVSYSIGRIQIFAKLNNGDIIVITRMLDIPTSMSYVYTCLVLNSEFKIIQETTLNSQSMPTDIFEIGIDLFAIKTLNHIQIWKKDTNNLTYIYSQTIVCRESCVLKDDMLITGDKLVDIWKKNNQNVFIPIATAGKHNKTITKIIKLDNNSFATSSYDGTIKIWKNMKCIETVECIDTRGSTEEKRVLDCRTMGLIHLQNGNLMCGLCNGKILIFEKNNWKKITELDGHDYFTESLVELKDQTVVSSSYETKIWGSS